MIRKRNCLAIHPGPALQAIALGGSSPLVIMKKRSLWMEGVSSENFSSLKGVVKVDVLVVGAGITGLTTGYLLKQTGRTVAIVDQNGIGKGETAHTTAHITFVTDARLHQLVSRLGKIAAQAFWQAGHRAMRQIEEITERLKIDCGLSRVPGYLFAAFDKDKAKEAESLKEDASLARGFGFDAEFVENDPLFRRPAVRFSNQLKFHPLKYVNGLARAIPGEGSYVFSKTSGSNIDSDRHDLRAAAGRIKYDTIVAATHVPIQGERGTFGAALFQTKLAAYSTYALEAEIEPRAESLYWDTNDPYLYLRFDKRESKGSVIVGGEDHKTGQEEDTEARYRRLGQFLKDHFPRANPKHRWSGQVLETPDGLPFIGEVVEKQFLATGFSGNGITLGTFSALLIRDLLIGTAPPGSNLFAPNRKSINASWDYLRENKDFVAYFVKDRLGSAPALEKLKRNSGGVFQVDGAKQAVYCDARGQRITLSPVCPHMGCIVTWNDAEKTWDCPCHGSRFEATGDLIAGPAESGLEPLQARRRSAKIKRDAR